eukprot:TRINITY_DN9966_c0_g1_i3.p2 TRINITY_DN9966_c0_g1~~TRINITY_DN9966_c0_g1_i3.p2  ORF type:complete len:136 (-),score=36.28 TRINITY_DN9966_c0_g1_i3:78-485(-)
MAGHLMKEGKVDRVLVGADRIAMNGDFANKIGTYSLAVLAKFHGIPFHAVAPTTTLDFNCETGEGIPIEQRKSEEVCGAFGITWTPKNTRTYNPSFDVTPGKLLTSLILDVGMIEQEKLGDGFSLKSLSCIQVNE